MGADVQGCGMVSGIRINEIGKVMRKRIKIRHLPHIFRDLVYRLKRHVQREKEFTPTDYKP